MNSNDPVATQTDADLMNSRRAFPEAQELLRGATFERVAEGAAVGWHGSEVSPETGCVALVREDGPYTALVGEIVKLTHPLATGTRSVYVYVFATAAVLDDISISRRAFLALGILANANLDCVVETIA